MTDEVLHKLPWPAIWEFAGKRNIDGELIAAIILQESGGNQYAMRFEPKWRYFKDVDLWAATLHCTAETERTGQATSWGVMQVMGGTARSYKFGGWFTELCDPEANIEVGSHLLMDLLEKYREPRKAVSAYNAGVPTDKNSGYVDKVLENYFSIKEEMKNA